MYKLEILFLFLKEWVLKNNILNTNIIYQKIINVIFLLKYFF